jgi:membrane protein
VQAVKKLIAATYRPGASLTATIVSIILILAGASSAFAMLRQALNIMWQAKPKTTSYLWEVLRERVLSFIMITVIGFLFFLSMLVSAGLAGAGNFIGRMVSVPVIFFQILDVTVTLIFATLLFACIFKILPDVKIDWADVWIGSALTAVLFTLGKFLLGLYLGLSGISSAYGAAGSLVAILVWIYYSAQILFLGAEFTQVYAHRYGKKHRPDAREG